MLNYNQCSPWNRLVRGRLPFSVTTPPRFSNETSKFTVTHSKTQSTKLNRIYSRAVRRLIFTVRCTLVQSAVLRSHVVRLSACDVGELWSHRLDSSKIISPFVSLGCSLCATLTWRVCSKENTSKFGPKVTNPPVDLSVGDIRSQIAAEWLQIAQWSQWRAYRKLPSLFRCHRGPPTTSLPPKMRVPYAPNIL